MVQQNGKAAAAMTTKREWPRKLRALQKNPRPLTPAECEELILLVGGTTRPRSRPRTSARAANWTAVAEVVFSFLENAEQLVLLQSEHIDVRERAQQAGELISSAEKARSYVDGRITALRPISAKTRSHAERKASEWFRLRDISLSPKQIQNALNSMRQEAGLKRLGLLEWRAIKRAHNRMKAPRLKKERREFWAKVAREIKARRELTEP